MTATIAVVKSIPVMSLLTYSHVHGGKLRALIMGFLNI